MPAFATAKLVEGYRANVEDRAEVFERGSDIILVVADGSGGTGGGAGAAETALDRVRKSTANIPALRDPVDWCAVLTTIDQTLQKSHGGGETTCVVGVVSASGIVGASVGDSGAWLITKDGINDLTSRQHRKPLLGTGTAMPVSFQAPLTSGTLLFASDGLLKYAPRDRIREVALESDLEAAVSRLVDLARLRSGSLPDDVAVILCRAL